MSWKLQRSLQAVKETPHVIPHCRIPLEGTEVAWRWEGNDLWCTVTVAAHYKTGIEMEALTGVALASCARHGQIPKGH